MKLQSRSLAARLGWLSGKPALVVIFMLCALPIGISMALLTPPGQVPDEPNHMARAAGLLDGDVLLVHQNHITSSGKRIFDPGVRMQSGLYAAATGHITTTNGMFKVYMLDLWIMHHEPAMPQKLFAPVPNTASYFPAAYVPAALGLAIGLLAKASPFICLMLARLSMLAAFLLAGALAIWLAAGGEALLLGVLLMPMTLFLAGSINEDGVLVGLACLAAACLSKDPLQFSKRRIAGIILLVLILGAKPPYLPLLGLCLLPLSSPGLRRRIGQAVLACVPVLGWLGLIFHYAVVPFGRPPYHPGPFFAGDRAVLLTQTNTGANLHSLLVEPSRLLSLPWHSIVNEGSDLLRQMIGVLGLLQLRFSDPYYLCWGGCLMVALLGLIAGWRISAARMGPALLDAAAVMVLLAGTCYAVMISMYLSWTYVGADFIDGLQGRYILPLLPFLLLAFPGRPRFALPAVVPALPVIAIGLADLGFLPLKLMTFYYLH